MGLEFIRIDSNAIAAIAAMTLPGSEATCVAFAAEPELLRQQPAHVRLFELRHQSCIEVWCGNAPITLQTRRRFHRHAVANYLPSLRGQSSYLNSVEAAFADNLHAP